jgi:hypothetical protein
MSKLSEVLSRLIEIQNWFDKFLGLLTVVELSDAQLSLLCA